MFCTAPPVSWPPMTKHGAWSLDGESGIKHSGLIVSGDCGTEDPLQEREGVERIDGKSGLPGQQ